MCARYMCECVCVCVCIHVNCMSVTSLAKIIYSNFNRYGREDLEVFGLNFRRDLVDVGVAEHLHCLT